jgi:O-antigen/teichoic acid export membrane protein
MARVLAIVALMAIPKAMMMAPNNLLQTTENQRRLILWGCAGGAVDILLDIVLIPSHGAVGAALANGAGQIVAAVGVWFTVWRLFKLNLHIADFARIAAAGAAMAAASIAVHRVVPGKPGMAVAIVAGAVVWIVALRLVGALHGEDASRLVAAGRMFPGPLQPYWKQVIGVVIPQRKWTRAAAPVE